MKIWLIKTGEPTLHDKGLKLLRTGILANHLSLKNQVVWFSSTFLHQKKKQRYSKTTVRYKNNIKHVYLRGASYIKNISFMRFWHQITSALEFYLFLKRESQQKKPNIIVSSFPTIEISYIAFLYAKKNKIPFVLDVRDMWPDIFKKELPLIKFIFFYPIYLIYEYITYKLFTYSDSIVSISSPFIKWAQNKVNRSVTKNDNYFFLSNPPTIQKNIKIKNNIKNFLKLNKKKKIIVFSGNLNTRNNLTNFLSTFTLHREIFKNLAIIICGDGDNFIIYKQKFNNKNNILFTGWVDESNLSFILKNSNYGLLSYVPSFDFQNSYPNKIADYLFYNLKIIASSKGIVGKLINKYKIGYNFRYNDKISITNMFKVLSKDKKITNSFFVYKKYFDKKKIISNFEKHLKKIVNEKNI